MAKPIIGLTGPSQFTPDCVDMVEQMFGGEPLMLYMNDPDTIKKWVKKCNGIVLAGGVDLHPSVYDESVTNGTNFSRFDLKRDLRELQIIETATEFKKPLFGICRGHQMMGVNKGLKLCTDLSHGAVCHQPGNQIDLKDWEPTHSIDLVNPEEFAAFFNYKGTPERKLINSRMSYNAMNNLWVNSFHHQGLHYTGSKKNPDPIADVKVHGISYVGLQECKYIIELMSGDGWLSCQWHPEHDWKVNTASQTVLAKFKSML